MDDDEKMDEDEEKIDNEEIGDEGKRSTRRRVQWVPQIDPHSIQKLVQPLPERERTEEYAVIQSWPFFTAKPSELILLVRGGHHNFTSSQFTALSDRQFELDLSHLGLQSPQRLL